MCVIRSLGTHPLVDASRRSPWSLGLLPYRPGYDDDGYWQDAMMGGAAMGDTTQPRDGEKGIRASHQRDGSFLQIYIAARPCP
jgi:hypothetical protein